MPTGKKGRIIVLDQALVTSPVWLSLKGKAPKVYLIFRTKCRVAKVGAGKRQRTEITNNGELIFKYDEAKKLYRISDKAFTRAIDELIEKGFLDISESGQGVCKLTTKYAISDRWKNYETREFKKATRPMKGIRRNGFQKGNDLWKRGQRKNQQS